MKLKRKESDIYVCISVSLVGFTTLSLFALLSGQASASTYTSDITVAIPASCTISSSNDSYSTTIISGNTGTITGSPVSITCNDASGYAVYAIGYSGDTYTGDYHTDMIASLGSTYNIKTDGTDGASYWKMKLDNTTNVDATIVNGYSDFQVIPASYTKIVSHTTSTATASITPVYQVYIGENQVAGSYVGKVKYTLLHPNTMTPAGSTYTITYNANGGSGTMTSNTPYTFDDFTLPDSTFTAPSGYVFAGWCTTDTAGPYACDGTSYTDEGTIPASVTSNNTTLNLYAYWEEIPAPGLCTDRATCMQTATACGTPLVDSRTGVSYLTVTIGNKCYMEQNLYLPTNLTLTKDDTNITRDTWTTPTASLTAGDSFTEARMVAGTHTNNTYNATGGWYNYCAASAGNVCSETQANASEDICPAGWRLPTMDEISIIRYVDYSNWNFYAGYYYNGSLRSASSVSDWWSATANSDTFQWHLHYYTGGMSVMSYYKYAGNFVRCVRK